MDLLWASGVLAAALGWGALLESRRSQPELSLARIAVVGLALLSTWVTLLGVAGLLRAPILLATVYGVAAAGWWRLRSFRGGERRAVPSWFRFLWLSFLGAAFWRALAVDTSADPYHGTIAKAFLLQHSIRPFPGVCESTYAMSVEMLDVLAFAHGTGNAPAILSAFFYGLAAWVAFRILLDGGEPRAGAVAGTILLTAPFLARSAGTSHTETAQALFLVAALASGLRYCRTSSRLDLVETGLLIGVLAGTKDSSLLLLGAPLLVALFAAWSRWRPRVSPGAIAWALAALFLPALGWVIRKWAATGDPFYPFLTGRFPVHEAFRAPLPLFEMLHPLLPSGAVLTFVREGREMLVDGAGEVLFGAVALVLLAIPKARRAVGPVSWGAALAFLWSLAARNGQSRFVAPLVPLFALVAGELFAACDRFLRTRRPALATLLLAALVLSLAVRYPQHVLPMYTGELWRFPPLTARQRFERAREADPGLAIVPAVNARLGGKDRLLVASPPRHLEYLDVPFVPPSQLVWDLREVWRRERFVGGTHELVWGGERSAFARPILRDGEATLSALADPFPLRRGW